MERALHHPKRVSTIPHQFQTTVLLVITAKLLEAEGPFNEPLANAYGNAERLLGGALNEAGAAGTMVKDLEACFESMKTWHRTALDMTKVLWRPVGVTVHRADGQKSRTMIKVRYACA